MRDTSLPAGVVAAATAPAYQARHALRIGFDTPLLLCEGPGSLVVNGETYTEGIISVGKVQVGPTPAVTVRVRNGDNEISAIDADNDGARDIAVLLYEVLWDPATSVQLGPVSVFPGVISQVQYCSGYADLQCTSRVPGQAYAGMVGRYVSQLCVHMFKGKRCQYAGAATACDRTMATCQALSNLVHYGGFPSVPAIGTIFKYKVSNGTTLTQTAAAAKPASSSLPPDTPPNGSGLRRKLVRG